MDISIVLWNGTIHLLSPNLRDTNQAALHLECNYKGEGYIVDKGIRKNCSKGLLSKYCWMCKELEHKISNLAFYLQWYLGLVDYGHWKMIVDTHINEEDKIEALKGQLSENKDR